MAAYWVLELRAGLADLEAIEARRRAEVPSDPVADGIALARAEVERRLAVATDPTRRLTVAEWIATQPRRITPQSVREWCAKGQLDAVRGADGQWMITAGAERRVARPSRRRDLRPATATATAGAD